DLLHIRSDIHRGWSVIELMDAKGALVGRWAPSLVHGATALDLGSVPNGLYMLRIRTERNTLHKRVLIE
ncbi:MAG: T9SS C-terminal target domain-containing protein, partial [Flavobacteriia bacterium]|nr:T9SS C-terminal target domain-containing protein [Flavobacteriia bacterium]